MHHIAGAHFLELTLCVYVYFIIDIDMLDTVCQTLARFHVNFEKRSI